jgi:TRAP transporter TAXI family solute receptor
MEKLRIFKYLAVSLLALTAPAGLYAQIPKCDGMPEGGLRLATGADGGSYLAAGDALRYVSPALDIRPCTTNGTLENLKLLTDGKVELALGQSDMLHSGWNGEVLESMEKENFATWHAIKFEHVQLVSWMFSERLQVLTSAHSYINSIQDLRRKKVWRGLVDSGAYATANEVLRAAGVDPNALEGPKPALTNYPEANKQLLDGKLDAVFRIGAVPIDFNRDITPNSPAKTVSEVFKQGSEIRMVSLDQGLVNRLLQDSVYVESTIYRDTYPGLTGGVRTIGLGAMLITRDNLTPSQSARVAGLYKFLHSWEGQRAAEKQMNIELDLLTRRLDPAETDDAKIIYSHLFPPVAKELTVDPVSAYRWPILFGLSVVVFLLALYRTEWLLNVVGRRSKYLVTAGILASACVLFALVLWIDERRFSAAFKTPVAAVQSLFMYFAHGMKSDSVMTENGQFFALLALAVIATLVHRLHSDALDDSVENWSKRLSNLLHGRAGYLSKRRVRVVVNWNELARTRVEGWCQDAKKNDQIIVLGAEPLETIPANLHGKLLEGKGDPARQKDLAESLSGAMSVLICSNWRSPYPEEKRRSVPRELADSLTIRTVYAIRTLGSRDKSIEQIPIVAEILLPANEDEAKNAGGPNTEIVPAFSTKVIVISPLAAAAADKAAAASAGTAN